MRIYLRVFERCGLQAMVVEASGGAFTKQFSHEFQVLTEAGEDFIEFDSMINLKPQFGNRSRSVENEEIQNKIREVVGRLIL